jgi:two-component sensor histidine kinase
MTSSPPGPSARGDDPFSAQEANHRFANHLALLSGFVRLKAADLARQPASPTTTTVLLLLESLHAQIMAASGLHRALALDVGSVRQDLGAYLRNVCVPLSAMLSGRIAIVEEIKPGCDVPPDHILPLTQIASEVITNAVKHAYSAGRPGRILVRGWREDDGSTVIEVADDGPGLPEAFDVERAPWARLSNHPGTCSQA